MSGNRKKKAVSDGCPGASEPIAKRTRTADKKVVSTGGNDYLDILNEDCWREILDYVELTDLVRSECVSKRWQHIVQRYLQGERLCLRVKRPIGDAISIPTTSVWHVPLVKCRNLDIRSEHHVAVIEKYGRAVVAADCVDGSILTALGTHASDLEDLRVIDPIYLRLKPGDQFNKLRRVSFHNVIMFSDRHIRKFLSPTLEELKIIHNLKIAGECLNLTSLRSLSLAYCYALKINHLLSAPFTELTKLELQGNSMNILKDSWRIIKRTPKLEYLGLLSYPKGEVGELTEAICGLDRLKHLNLDKNMNADDDMLESIGRRCGELRTVNIGFCHNVSSAGVVTLCRVAAKTLTALNVSGSNEVTDDDMALCISLCPKLEFLDVRHCELMSPARFCGAAAAALARGTPGGAGRARGAGGAGGAGAAGGAGGRRLRLAVSRDILEVTRGYRCMFIEQPVKSYDNLIMEFQDADRKWEDYLKNP